MNKFSLAISPCPNDTFIFDALIHRKIDSKGFAFETIFADVEQLNRWAEEKKFDIIKISFATYPFIEQHYQLMDAGSALGMGCGPLLVSEPGVGNWELNKSEFKIAIPGKHTTANLLFTIFFPEVENKVEMVFSEIENAILNKEVDAGVIIHENRFTYKKKGLKKIADLGELWEQSTKMPIPLGGIAVRREFSAEKKMELNTLTGKSIEYALANPLSGKNFIKQHAQEMDEEVIRKHISLYVNEYSISLGETGMKAITLLFEKGKEKNLLPGIQHQVFALKTPSRLADNN
jgi:1,4-dihydroxy-6-naphthoate synthase